MEKIDAVPSTNIDSVPGRIIIDSCIGIKLFNTDEEHSDIVPKILHGRDLVVPAVFWIEISRKLREMTIPDPNQPGSTPKFTEFGILNIIRDIEIMGIKTIDVNIDFIRRTFMHAVPLGHKMYDCMFMVASLEEGITIITEDNKLYKKTHDLWGKYNLNRKKRRSVPPAILLRNIEE